jgi:hypothetical protein
MMNLDANLALFWVPWIALAVWMRCRPSSDPRTIIVDRYAVFIVCAAAHVGVLLGASVIPVVCAATIVVEGRWKEVTVAERCRTIGLFFSVPTIIFAVASVHLDLVTSAYVRAACEQIQSSPVTSWDASTLEQTRPLLAGLRRTIWLWDTNVAAEGVTGEARVWRERVSRTSITFYPGVVVRRSDGRCRMSGDSGGFLPMSNFLK